MSFQNNMKQSANSIIKDVDAVNDSFNRILAFLEDLTHFDNEVANMGMIFFTDFVETYKLHIDRSLDNAYLDGTSNAAKSAIDALLNESGISRLPELEFLVDLSDSGPKLVMGRFNPLAVESVIGSGTRLVGESEIDSATIFFKSGNSVTAACSPEKVGEVMDRFDPPPTNQDGTTNSEYG